MGVSKADLTAFSRWANGSPRENDRDIISAALQPNAPALQLTAQLGIKGPALCPMAACATGLVSIIRGVQMIRDGACEAVLAGSVDASLTPALLGCYRRMKVLASGFDDPRSAMRPFESDRCGFLAGEGAGVLLLESANLARSRNHQPLARVLGCALGNDPSGLTEIDVTGETLACVVRDALQRSQLSASDVDAVQVHGTATWQNDVCEARALRRIWGGEPPPVISIKGAIGHLLGGAGSVETAFAALALRDRMIPPACNFSRADPDCRLDLSAEARSHALRSVLKLSLGFGGHLAAIVLQSPDAAAATSRE
jgi:3-oxoacyl-[acyl-carrier-protein] synthase II